MKKKIISAMLAAAMMVGLVGCGGSSTADTTESSADSATETTEAAEETTETASGDSYNVIMQIVTFGNEFSGIADVETAINAITEPEIGVTVTLSPVNAWDLPSTSAMEITSGEKLDLMCVMPMASSLDAIVNYSSKNMLEPLDDLLAQYGTDITAKLGNRIEIGYTGGTLYGIPVNYSAGNGSGFVVRTDIMKELGFDFDTTKVYTTADLEPMFAAYKEKYGDGNYAIAAIPAGDVFTQLYAVDNTGTDTSDGVIMNGGKGDTTVVNMYETDEYAQFAQMMYDWNQKGYFNPDVTTIQDDWTAQIAAGNYLGAFANYPSADGLDVILNNSLSAQNDLTPIKLVEDYATTGMASEAFWTIPVTCENPEKTMQFLNMLYQDRELKDSVMALIGCGIEGTSYEMVTSLGGSRGIAKYANGYNQQTVPYEQCVPIYGDQYAIPKMEPITEEIANSMASYNEELEKAGAFSDAFGYAFDASALTTEKAAVQNVISQYRADISYGNLDPATALPEFISQLKAAGIDTLIEENQKQLDAWAASK